MKITLLKLQGPCKHAYQSFITLIQHHIHKSMLFIASHPQRLLKYQPYVDCLWSRTQFSHVSEHNLAANASPE